MSADHELRLLGAALAWSDVWPQVGSELTDDAWTHTGCFALWSALRGAGGYEVPARVRDLAVGAGMDPSGYHEIVGLLLEHAAIPAEVPYLIGVVADEARVRRVQLRTGVALSADPEDAGQWCAEVVRAATDAAGDATRARWTAGVDLAAAALERRTSGQQGVPRLPMPWHEVEAMGCGVPRGRFTVVAGRPGMGKTTAALVLAAHWASQGLRVAVSSLEMGAGELGDRMLARLAGQRRGLTAEQANVDAADEMARWSLAVDDTPGLTASEIVLRAEGARRMLGGLDALVVDHFHLLAHRAEKGERTDEAMGRSSGVLRDWAKNQDIAVVLAAQLNRDSERRGTGVPRLADLRECGALEQDGYMVVAPYRPAVMDSQADPGELQWHVIKHRGGRCGSVGLHWNGEAGDIL